MNIIVVLVCLGLQRYLHLNSFSHQVNWLTPYYQKLRESVPLVHQGHGMLGLAIIVVPVLVVVSLFFTLMFHLTTIVGYYLCSIALLWYCIDGRDYSKEPLKPNTADNLLQSSYKNLFAILFWFFLLGPVGLALYVTVKELNKVLAEHPEESAMNLAKWSATTLSALDWVPVRLLGLSFALVGSFGAVFKLWVKQLVTGLQDGVRHVVEWGQAAIAPASEHVGGEASKTTVNDAVALVDRGLLVWLVVMALITVGVIFG